MKAHLVHASIVALFTVAPPFTGNARGADSWGAIYYSPSTGAHGSTANYDSQETAEAVAEKRCRDWSGGATDCSRAAVFKNGCGALAKGESGGWGDVGLDSTAAKLAAMQRCSLQSRGCTIVTTVCTGSAH